MEPPPFGHDFRVPHGPGARGPQHPGFGGRPPGRGAFYLERRLDEIERKIDRILQELKRDDDAAHERRDDDDETDASVYDELTLDEAGFESY